MSGSCEEDFAETVVVNGHEGLNGNVEEEEEDGEEESELVGEVTVSVRFGGVV